MKGIIFKPDSIGAIIEGRKTQTRRVIRQLIPEYEWEVIDAGEPIRMFKDGVGGCLFLHPRYQVGETVYIKEAYCFPIPMDNLSPSEIYSKYGAFHRRYLLDGVVRGENPFSLTMIDGRVRSPMMMPEWAARYFITITDARAERVQEISFRECEAEGIWIYEDPWKGKGSTVSQCRGRFARLWNSINKDYPFESDPWVWVYSFRKR